MPRFTYTAEFIVGCIHSEMEQLRRLINRLETRFDFTRVDLEHMRLEINEIEDDIRTQVRMIEDKRVQPKFKEFEKLLSMVREARLEYLDEIEANDGRRPSPLQFGEVTMSMLNAKPARQPSKAELKMYDSDNEEDVPLEFLSTIKTTPAYQPISFRLGSREDAVAAPKASTSRQAGSRHHRGSGNAPVLYDLSYRNDRRQNDSPTDTSCASKSTEESSRTGESRTRENCRTRESRAENRHEKGRNEGAAASKPPASGSSRYSYVSQPQEQFARPVSGCAYPPFGTKPPVDLVRNNPDLIGSTEVYVRRPTRPDICPLCPGGKHRMHQCKTFLRAGLQERWYIALKAGVCLNCLIHGHSHFTCKDVGACFRCKRRHNSKLCPHGPIVQ